MPEESQMKKVIKNILIAFAILGGLYASTRYFVTHEVFDMVCAETKAKFTKVSEKEYVRDLKQQEVILGNKEINQMQFKRLEPDSAKRQDIQIEINSIRDERSYLKKQIRDLEK